MIKDGGVLETLWEKVTGSSGLSWFEITSSSLLGTLRGMWWLHQSLSEVVVAFFTLYDKIGVFKA